MHHEIVMKDGYPHDFTLYDLGDDPAGRNRVHVGVLRHGAPDGFDDAGLYHPDSRRLHLIEFLIEPPDHGADVVQVPTLFFHDI